MRVRMMTTYAGPRGNAGPGQVIEVGDAEAEQLIAGHFAVALKPPVSQPAETETPDGGQADEGAQGAELVKVSVKRRK